MRLEVRLAARRPSRARAACARGRRAASRASSRIGRHSAARARCSRVSIERRRRAGAALDVYSCALFVPQSPPRGKRPQRGAAATTTANQSGKGWRARSQRLSDDRACARRAPRPRSTRCRAASPISRTIGEALDYAAQGRRGLNFHDARGTLTRAYPYSRAARGRAGRTRAASSRSASSRATASRWSPRPAPSSPPASSARSMPAPGRCRCRCRPASAAAKPMSTSSASS